MKGRGDGNARGSGLKAALRAVPSVGRSLYWTGVCSLVVSSCIYAENQSTPKHVSDGAQSQSQNRDDWFLHGRAGAGNPAALRYQTYREKMRLRAQRPGAEIQATKEWSPLGPAPLASDLNGDGTMRYNWVSGRATAVAVDPSDASGNTVYAGGAYGGVWKSTNGASLNPANVAWTPLIDDQPTLSAGAIAVQPGGTGVVLVGTGEPDSAMDSYYGLGILRSTNSGATWTLIQTDVTGMRSFDGMGFARMAFSTASPNVVVAATASTTEGITEGLENPVTTNLGIYGSTNSGSTWTYGNITDGNTTISPGSATSVIYNAAAGLFFAAIRYHGFYSSPDGMNWSRLANQPGAGLTTTNCPPAAVTPSACPIYRGEIAAVADPKNPIRNELYVWYVDPNNNDQGIWASTDSGNTWTALNESGIVDCGDELGCGAEDGAYNLALAAIADGTTTDLYAGAVNLYKCTTTGSPLQCFSPFINLTHAYGCPPNFASIAHVHPAQHAIAFLVTAEQQEIMYFANDGGVYRALNGYTGLTSGTCGTPNAFDSLNQTLGSMTQMVSFGQSAIDPDWILAGTTGNGAAATDSVEISSTWQTANTGDNGYTLIDPANEANWFTSNPPDTISGVNIFNCGAGMACDTIDFYNNQVVSSSTVGGDTGAYYPPYVFDATGSAEMIVGTCRVWRGPSAGGAYTVLSHSFETGGDGICTGTEVNLVRSLASGIASNGNEVMYAGTDGYGPLIGSTPPGGNVWVSLNIADGPSSWVDETGVINPNNYPISGIALDSSDPAAQTAYVTIQGWNTTGLPAPQVWQTTNAGASWTDFTGTGLPGAPVNAVLVYEGTVYVGTDEGVFASSTASANWAEFGTMLPDAPVTALAMYNDGKDQYLRASLYGRGLWQYPIKTTPYYVLNVSPSALTIFGDQQAQFNGRAVALNGYTGEVSLSCTGSNSPAKCSFSPNPVAPTAVGAAFTLTASGKDGEYNFNAAGVDGNQLKFSFPLKLNVIDFALTAPSPPHISVGVGETSGPVQFQVEAFGPFNETVSLGCSSLPTGAACKFEPASAASPTAGHPVTTKLTISVAPNTPSGTFPITVTGTATGRTPETQPLSLTVINSSDYSLKITSATSKTAVETADGALSSFSGILASVGGYDSAVNLTCVAAETAPPPTCEVSPATVTPSAGGAPFTVTVKSDVLGSYHFKILGTGTDASATTHSEDLSFATTFAFGLTNQSGAQSIAAGSTATYDLSLQPFGSKFPDSVNFACLGLPSLGTCSFTPATVAAGAGQTIVTFAVQTTAPVLTQNHSFRPIIFFAMLAPLFGLSILGGRTPRPIAALLIVLCLIPFAACGGGANGGGGGSANPGTPPGNYTITITATMGSQSLTPPLQVLLTVN
ncbi:MAG TPA: hypothetical protein VF753_15020 [Terriglobales bacterium]